MWRVENQDWQKQDCCSTRASQWGRSSSYLSLASMSPSPIAIDSARVRRFWKITTQDCTQHSLCTRTNLADCQESLYWISHTALSIYESKLVWLLRVLLLNTTHSSYTEDKLGLLPRIIVVCDTQHCHCREQTGWLPKSQCVIYHIQQSLRRTNLADCQEPLVSILTHRINKRGPWS